MNEELQKAISEIFSSVLSAKDFLVGEIPEYISQLLLWNAIYSATLFSIGVLIISACSYVGVNSNKFIQKRKERITQEQKAAREAFERKEKWCFYRDSSSVTSIEYDRIMGKGAQDDSFVVMACCWAFCLFIGFMFVSVNTDWLKIWIAPKVWLVEYAAKLIN